MAMGSYLTSDIDRISSHLVGLIEHIAVRQADWDDLAAAFVEAFPASFIAIHNMDFTLPRLNFFVQRNANPEFLESYHQHYVFINPWLDMWRQTPSGKVLVAEEDCPARNFRGTPFYEEWVKPQKDIEGASGLKIAFDSAGFLHVPVHYPLRFHEVYDPATAAVLERLSAPLTRAAKLGRALSHDTARLACQAALTQRFDRAAMVIDADMAVRDANQRAVDGFVTGAPFELRGNRLSLACRKLGGCFAQNVRRLVLGLSNAVDEFCVEVGGSIWLIHLAPIRLAESRGLSALVPPAPQVLVLARDLTAFPPAAARVTRFATVHRLTPAEARLCETLAEGHTVAEASERLSISQNTARERLKAIFAKTATGRQTELIRAIMNFG